MNLWRLTTPPSGGYNLNGPRQRPHSRFERLKPKAPGFAGGYLLGAYATARIYPADRLVRIPDGVSDIQAAASFLRGVTARMLLKEVVPLQSDDVVLFHAAAGGVGLLFAQRALGAPASASSARCRAR